MNKKLQYYWTFKIRISLLFIILIIFINGCCVTKQQIKGNDGREYGVVKGLFLCRWWNYYERGLSFADGALTYMDITNQAKMKKASEIFELAEKDLIDAMSLRYKDQWRARTYGMHFMDYFPHRELGIIRYYQAIIAQKTNNNTKVLNLLEDAMKEIEISLYGNPLSDFFKQNITPNYTAQSEKAIVYLNKIRTKWTEITKPGEIPDLYLLNTQTVPQKQSVEIWDIYEPHMTYLDNIILEGRISNDVDMKFIEITINDNKSIAPVSGTQFYFFKMVKLRMGENTIEITSVDKANNRFSLRRNIQKHPLDFDLSGNQLKINIEKVDNEANKSNPLFLDKFASYLEKIMRQKPRFIVLSSSDKMQPDCILKVRFLPRAQSVEVVSELVDIETTIRLTAADTFTQADIFIEGIIEESEVIFKNLATSLNVKLANQWPVLTGKAIVVTGDKGDRIQADMDFKYQAKKGMKVLFFDKQIRPEIMMISKDIKYSGRIESNDNSVISIVPDNKDNNIETGMQIITR